MIAMSGRESPGGTPPVRYAGNIYRPRRACRPPRSLFSSFRSARSSARARAQARSYTRLAGPPFFFFFFFATTAASPRWPSRSSPSIPSPGSSSSLVARRLTRLDETSSSLVGRRLAPWSSFAWPPVQYGSKQQLSPPSTIKTTPNQPMVPPMTVGLADAPKMSATNWSGRLPSRRN